MKLHDTTAIVSLFPYRICIATYERLKTLVDMRCDVMVGALAFKTCHVSKLKFEIETQSECDEKYVS